MRNRTENRCSSEEEEGRKRRCEKLNCEFCAGMQQTKAGIFTNRRSIKRSAKLLFSVFFRFFSWGVLCGVF